MWKIQLKIWKLILSGLVVVWVGNENNKHKPFNNFYYFVKCGVE